MSIRSTYVQFNPSLRGRPPWATVADQLSSHYKKQCQEVHLNGYDISLSVSDEELERHDELRILLLSSEDIRDNQAAARIERFVNSSRTSKRMLMFLVQKQVSSQVCQQDTQDRDRDDAQQKSQDPMTLYMKLQAELMQHTVNIPILPLVRVDSIVTALHALQTSLLKSMSDPGSQLLSSLFGPRDLLPYCSDQGVQPLAKEHAGSLSQNYFTIGEIVHDLRTEGGRRRIAKIMGSEEENKLLRFWTDRLS
ncbi:hypothetical protein QBC35DRAFT_554036 [Podospora australis]|uniref:Uncharacterized protein n=1 Tax=Podospora australis TaxID=1536484 RepID=A0AAN7AI14_9PEZI|nr:hypothetical protein QBC35DRAFT_554036 [Podospora australis]